MITPQFGTQLRTVFRQSLPVYLLFGAYFLFALTASFLSGSTILFLQFAGEFGPTVMVLLLLWLVLVCAFKTLRQPGERPLLTFALSARDLLSPRLIDSMLMVPVILLFLQFFLNVKTLLPAYFHFGWDGWLADLDRTLHGGVDPWFLLQPWLGQPAITYALELAYSAMWLVAVVLVPLIMTFALRDVQLRRRYFFTYVSSWFLLGNLLAGLMLSAGPCYYDTFTGDTTRFAPMIEYLRGLKSHALSAIGFRDLLLRIYQTGEMSQFGGISAFPSMHISMATLLACFTWQISRWLFVGAVAFLLTMLVASVHLGWHYAVDGYASIVLTVLIWFWFGLIFRPKSL